MVRMSRLIVAGCIVASLLGACSSDKVSRPPNRVLTKAEYIKAADDICEVYGDRIRGIVNTAGGGLTLEQAKETYTEKLIPLFAAQLAELRKLRPPKADAEKLRTTFLERMGSAINTIAGRVSGAQSLNELDAIRPSGTAQSKNAAVAYGMKHC